MAKSDFENLRVYQLAEGLADLVWDAAVDWNLFAKDTVGKQLVRAADSIGANIAEGAGRGRFDDNKRFVRYARGSLNETKHFLRRAYKRKLLRDEAIAPIKNILENLPPQLNSYLKSIGREKRGEDKSRP